MNESFGNIQKQSLEEALSQPDFRKYWDLTKDQIEICKIVSSVMSAQTAGHTLKTL